MNKRKWVQVFALFLIISFSGCFVSKRVPNGIPGEEADQLAEKMMSALNSAAYDSITEIRWSFPRGHHFVWNKQENKVNVKWDDYEVLLDPSTISGIAYENNVEQLGELKEKTIQKAWKLFANDSFWLVAPYKVFDPGTTRSIVKVDDGHGLLITYQFGGVTPGDSYLWVLDDQYRPKYWKMWVSIIPIGGIKVSWQNWQKHNGAWFAPDHEGPLGIDINLINLSVR
ncbi:MAG: hypothetical protein JXQ90_20155 [Cyclobacteriaceae bacterium]